MAGGRTPGDTSGGGRTKGTPNKKTAELKELIEEVLPGFHPIVAMAKIAHMGLISRPQFDEAGNYTGQKDLPIGDEYRTRCLTEVGQYLYPKRKAVEHSGELKTSGGVLLVENVKTADRWLAEGEDGSGVMAAVTSQE